MFATALPLDVIKLQDCLNKLKTEYPNYLEALTELARSARTYPGLLRKNYGVEVLDDPNIEQVRNLLIKHSLLNETKK